MTIAEVYFLLVNPFHPRDPKKNDDEERGGVGPPKGFEARFIALTIATCVVGILFFSSPFSQPPSLTFPPFFLFRTWESSFSWDALV